MFTYQFADELTVSPFSFSNLYNYGPMEATDIAFSNWSKEVAFIFKEPTQKHRSGFLMYANTSQFRRRTITKERALHIINTARVLLKITYQREMYLMGKGFIGLFDERSRKVHMLFIATIPNHDNWVDTDLKFYESKLLRTRDYRHIQVLAETLIGDHKGDIILTDDISKLVGDRLTIPAFETLSARNTYVRDLVSFCLAEEKRKFA